MLFDFDVIELFGDGVSVLDNRMTTILVDHGSPDRTGYAKTSSSPRRGRHDSVRRERIYHVIDKMGEASAKAQGLHGSITGAYRLTHSDHHLYVMVDRKTNSDLGSVVGLLKVGHKTLFVYDRQNRQREMNPLCVLDFYVHESRQRTGCGRKLFDSMLRREHVRVEHLAVDRPSHKFSAFLRKHYNLKTIIPQVNNFVVFEGFFANRTDEDVRRMRTAFSRPPPHPDIPRPYSHYDRTSGSPNTNNKKTSLITGNQCNKTTTNVETDLPINQVELSRDYLSDFSRLEIKRKNQDVSERLQPEVKAISEPEAEMNRTDDMTYEKYVPSIATPEPDRGSMMSRPRDGPSTDYRNFIIHLNQHQSYQDRRGRLLVSDKSTRSRDDVTATNDVYDQSPPISITRHNRINQSPTHPRSLPTNHDLDSSPLDQSSRVARINQSEHCESASQSTSWTVLGTPPSYYGRKWQHTKLW